MVYPGHYGRILNKEHFLKGDTLDYQERERRFGG